jgi:hypothetical protein
MAETKNARSSVARIVKKNPRQSASAIAKAAGISRQRAYQLLDALGYELVVYWRKKHRTIR